MRQADDGVLPAASPQLTGIVGERPLGRLAEAALTKLSTSLLRGMARALIEGRLPRAATWRASR
jgi:hypothetical protein